MELKNWIKKKLAILGYNIIKVPRSTGNILKDRLSRNLKIGYVHEDEAFEAMQVVSSNTMLPYEPLVTLFEQVVYCDQNNIDGDFVECGTWKGGATGMMALATLKYGPVRRHLHLFDAFQEICQPDEEHDDKGIIDEVKKLVKTKQFEEDLKPLTGVYDQFGGPGTLAENKKLLEQVIGYPADHLHYHVGWFQDTVPADAGSISKIAVLRLDGDWYQSTKVCLDHLYDKVVKDGIVIIDDYGYNTGCKKAVDEFLAAKKTFPILNYINNTCRYFIKP
ncbi:MAG: TylF/MycF/NovP-related O-methyltransferase [Chitinophagaceae bacterium]